MPILPIILSGSLTGSKSRPLGIIVGFVIAFTMVTLFSRAFVAYTHISSEVLRNISYGILLLLGIIMLSTYLTEKFTLLTARLTRIGSSPTMDDHSQGGFGSGIIFGGLIGIIWTPCAGPILAAVIVQAIIQETTLNAVLIVATFAIGVGLPMLLIALAGRNVVSRFKFFRRYATQFRQTLGFIIIASVFFLIYSTNLTLAATQSSNSRITATGLIHGLERPYAAPELVGIEAWINSPPLRISELKGKVILIDFWTYSCINCIRTLPYLKDWYAKYHDKGFEIIGVHSPEFEFERHLDNVKNAVKKFGILYPVALDNQFATWQRYHNRYWPAHYLINKNGEVVYQHFGEGEYDTTENNIRYLLGLTNTVTTNIPERSYLSSLTPEIYLGYGRSEHFSSPEIIVHDKPAIYSYPAELSRHHWALKGNWAIYPDKIIAITAGAAIKLHFNAGEVYAVMGADKPINVKITVLDNLPVIINGEIRSNRQMIVSRNQLYTVLHLKKAGEGIVELTAMSPGLEMYTFTFGM